MSDIESIKRLLEQHMPRLRDLIVLDCSRHWRDPPLTLCFHRYPNIQSLQLGLSLYYYSTAAPCASLRHLELTRCTMRPWPTCGYVPSLRSAHDALELFPNLETLTLIHSLSEGDWFGELPKLKKTVHLPRLRRLEIKDTPIYIPYFLSHLLFPSTTSLVLAPDYRLAFEDPLSVPVFPGINPSPAPDAELSLYLDFFYSSDPSLLSPEGLARWETHGSDARPVCVTLTGAARRLDPVAHFTRELVRALARPPGRGVASLTAKGTWARSPGKRHPLLLLSAREYWTAFLPDLAGLRRLACAGHGATRDFIDVLGQRLPQPACGGGGGTAGEFPCPRLAELALVWDVPTEACFELERDGLWVRAARGGGHVQGSGDESGSGSAGHGEGYPSQVGRVFAAALGELCDALGVCVTERAGLCEPIRKLSVELRGSYGWDLHVEQWQAALVEGKLRDVLGHLVGEVVVVDEVQ
ncbi:hypothetical protein GSI_14761 [Ganoderma sinense ZZ0214-1]|uniref:Uncharacterized protein n=1 Tax=Ganoderma sinense ZZ0214-1 TaxID=1077348 RepID=A0A2G8RPK8_9APHY|nr:hypothetical protein GSI_14761 [Ganoderma sinense ZZ0214-1]